jgi:hypothetical protein
MIRRHGYGAKRFFNWLNTLFASTGTKGRNQKDDSQDSNTLGDNERGDNEQDGSGNGQSNEEDKTKQSRFREPGFNRLRRRLDSFLPKKDKKD